MKKGGGYSPSPTKRYRTTIFLPPNTGLLQNPTTGDKIFQVINLVEMSDTEFEQPSTEPNIFLDMEALEVS